MNIEFMNEINLEHVDINDFINYLNEFVLYKIDVDVKNKNNTLNILNNSIKKINSDFINLKNRNTIILKEQAKEKQIYRILSLVGSLKKEGAIRGSLKKNVLDILKKINKLNFNDLRNIEEQLIIHLPINK